MNVSYVKPDYKSVAPSNPFSLDLMGRMLMDKVQRYEVNYAQLSQEAAINEATGASIMNLAAREYANQKLNSIMDNVNGELGDVDLSKMQNRQAFSSKIQEFSKDPRIVNAVGNSRRAAAELAHLQEAKKTGKGYGASNEWDLQRAVQEYSLSQDPDARFDGAYTPYVDVTTKITNYIKDAHPDVSVQITQGGQFSMWDKTGKALSPERVRSIVDAAYSDPTVQKQLDIDGRFKYRDIEPGHLKKIASEYYSGVERRIDKNIKDAQVMLSQVKSDPAQFNEWSAYIKNLEAQKKSISEYATDYNGVLSSMNPEGLKRMMHTMETRDSFADAFSYTQNETKYIPLTAEQGLYEFNTRLAFDGEQAALNRENELVKIGLRSGTVNPSGVGGAFIPGTEASSDISQMSELETEYKSLMFGDKNSAKFNYIALKQALTAEAAAVTDPEKKKMFPDFNNDDAVLSWLGSQHRLMKDNPNNPAISNLYRRYIQRMEPVMNRIEEIEFLQNKANAAADKVYGNVASRIPQQVIVNGETYSQADINEYIVSANQSSVPIGGGQVRNGASVIGGSGRIVADLNSGKINMAQLINQIPDLGEIKDREKEKLKFKDDFLRKEYATTSRYRSSVFLTDEKTKDAVQREILANLGESENGKVFKKLDGKLPSDFEPVDYYTTAQGQTRYRFRVKDDTELYDIVVPNSPRQNSDPYANITSRIRTTGGTSSKVATALKQDGPKGTVIYKLDQDPFNPDPTQMDLILSVYNPKTNTWESYDATNLYTVEQAKQFMSKNYETIAKWLNQ